MSSTDSNQPNNADVDVDAMVAKVESGARNAAGFAGRFILGLAFIWSAFQLYIASDLPFVLTQLTGVTLVFNNQEARQVHLAFAIALSMLAFPLFKSSPDNRVPAYDWVLAAVAAMACLYLLVFKESIANRAGLPTTADLIFSTIGMVGLGIAVFRALGLPLVIVASVFVFYVFFGHYSFMPDVIQWKGASYGKALWHYWMQTEGVFGVALGVSASMIFLFVLFGALLEKAGAGNYFIKLSFALLGHLRGGPAKAAVVASALSGLYSGSSIANVVTTGTFTIPLMKRTGFKPEKAGAVEVASSTNGQLTPPVMGAAAFLISEFTGVSYPDLIKHAFLPAVISYIALVYIVHLEALKLGLKGMQKPSVTATLAARLSNVLLGFIAISVLAAFVYYGLGWVKTVFPNMTFLSAVLIFLALYLGLVNLAARHPDLEVDDPNSPVTVLPKAWDVAVTGLYYLLPIIVLIWCILIERLSPTTSAYWATLAMIFIVFTQKPLKSLMRASSDMRESWRAGGKDFVDGMIAGARSMIPIGVATGAAGIIVGTVSLTGAHQVIGELVEFLSGGNIMIMLLLVAVMSLILGMGLPTTANYIVVSSLMAPVVVTVGAQSGLIVPLIAVHLFVFYFGILADDTPPVGLAAFAAAAISGGDPIKTGVQGFAYDIRTALLPFLFIFNTELLLIDVTWYKAIFIFIVATIAMMLFASATQGYFLARTRLWETLALLLVAFTLFRPGFWLDYIEPPYDVYKGTEVAETAGQAPQDGLLRMVISGPDFDDPDKIKELTLLVELGAVADGNARLEKAGLVTQESGGDMLLEEPFPGTPYFGQLQDYDFYGDESVKVTRVEVAADRMPKEVLYIPALILLLVVIASQRRRQTVPAF
ncbi:TRAP transporter fused permease subunit [Marinomonas mediterranea]|jgi:TRAP transporter, 4TM/12TM fusion protein|uniref:TRAP transporter, 4TM/12TM fusion protein n=1 Tax=Marinomonas mediterranea (strain ATCC 700492 / JCM 21426 / NBRC 103028 / MMB-1) TaxID=717774 RepID=F2JTU3_MARM1|nr:TRAP transporter permease [Marinomonas mediterranea]ADZ92713.1 TRAP transporter, 4TM/12TM fusion protein [Marinomonas mediterranea MMB-1]WCN14702.1 TRAP transporter fused permease subunit [Marinomonas mediterranea]WCN18742.1 TRAP transporter fused permease subunit [Marinomonas mediterranea MMB-1]